MADTHLLIGDYWLPSEFLTADDLLMGKPNLTSPIGGANFGSKLTSSATSPVESETDDEDLFAGLSRRLARATLLEKSQNMNSGTHNFESSWFLPTSPKSTLTVGSWSAAASNGGSPNGPSQFPSPPTTPEDSRRNDSLDLIYAAAEQVARLKNSAEAPGNRLFDYHRNSSPAMEAPNSSFYSNQFISPHFDHAGPNYQEGSWGRRTSESFFSGQTQFQQLLMSQNRRVLEKQHPHGLFPTSAFPPAIRYQNRRIPPPVHGGSGVRAVTLTRSGVKRECAGTGVFLPRRYDNNPPEPPRKKPGCSAALLPARNVQPQNNKNMDHMTAQTSHQAGFNGTFAAADYGNLMTPKKMLSAQQNWVQRQDVSRSHDLCLPQEWTY